MDPTIWQYHSCEFCQAITIEIGNQRDPVTGNEVAVLKIEEGFECDEWFFLGPTLEAFVAARTSCAFADKLSQLRWYHQDLGSVWNRLWAQWENMSGHFRLVVSFRSIWFSGRTESMFYLCEPNPDDESWNAVGGVGSPSPWQDDDNRFDIVFTTTRSTSSKLVSFRLLFT